MTTNGNGARETAPLLDATEYKGLPSVVELEMSSGITVWVRPASFQDQKLIRDEVNNRFPLPREADFKIPVPEDQATIPEQTMTDTEAYKEALGKVGREQSDLWIKLHILACVDFPDGLDTIVARYLPEIERKRRVLPLPQNDIEAVIMHAVIRTPEDQKLVGEAITQKLPVEMSEVIAQLRIFRPQTQRTDDHPVPRGRKAAPRAVMDTIQTGADGDQPVI